MSKRLISIFFVFIVIALVGLRAAFAPRMSAADEIVLSHQFAFSLIFIFLLSMWLGLEKWVACDANDRGLDSGRLWIMLARVLGLLDLIIYLRGIYLTPPDTTGCGLTKVANGTGPTCTAC
jgi:nitrogen fixation/metabolism regulation signal transduction histidine kinase